MPRSESREILAEAGDYGATTPVEASEVSLAPSAEPPASLWPPKRRHYVAGMAFLGFFNVYALRANLSIAIIEMTRNSTATVLRGGRAVTVLGEFSHWSSLTTGIILSSFFYGYILTQLPGGWLASRHGGVRVFGLGVLATSLLTLLTPPLAHAGAGVLVAVRVLEGLAEGVTYPAIHAVWRHWAPPMEKTRLATLAFAGSYFGNAVSMPLSAWLGEHFGWPSIFYVFGLVALGWAILWWKTVHDSPAQDPNISVKELAFIQASIGYAPEQIQNPVCRNNRRDIGDKDASPKKAASPPPQDLRPPWGEMLRSRAVWAIVAAHFAENWGFYTMLTYLPQYMRFGLGLPLERTGLASALPYLVMGVVVVAGGQAADHLRTARGFSTLKVRKGCVVLAFGAQAVFLLLGTHGLGTGLSVGLVTLAVGSGGLAWAGFSVNHLDIAPPFAPLLMGLSNTVATLPGIIGPAVVAVLVPDKTSLWAWRGVFYLVAAVYVAGGAVFALFASADVQPWAAVPSGYAPATLRQSPSPKRDQRDE